jgi:2'-hydroxyisoflavone reductase
LNALVLGGTRFIGRALVNGLLGDGHDVTLLHSGHHNPFGEDVERLVADRNDHDAVHRKLRGRRFDVVFEHAYVHPIGTRPEDVAAVLNALAAPPSRVVFTSSAAVYEVGVDVSSPIDEASAYATRGDPYSVHKIETERLLLEAHAEGRYEVAVVRPSFVIGPWNPSERLRFFWDRILADRTVLLPDQGETRLQFAYVDDVAAALRCVATHGPAGGQAYNVGWEEAISQRELVATLGRIAGHPVRAACVPREQIFAAGGSPFDAPYYFGESLDISGVLGEFHLSTDRSRRELPVTRTPWNAALQTTYAWYLGGRALDTQPDTGFEDEFLAGAPTMALESNGR